MPRQDQIKERGHFQFNDQYTHDFTTPNLKVSARMVDPHAKMADPARVQPDPDVEQFMAVMHNLGSAMKGYSDIRKQQDEEDRKAGAALAAAKGDLPEDASAGLIYGYELVKGKAAAGQLEEVLSKHFEANKDETPEHFAATQKLVVKQFLAGRSQAFVEGITPDALGREEHFQRQYTGFQKEKLASNVLANVSTGFMNDVDGIYQANDMDPMARAKAVRDGLSGAQEFSKSYGVDRMKVSAHMVTLLGERAASEGRPELLDFAFVEDKDGFSLAKRPELAAKVMAYKRHAEHAKEGMAREALQAKRTAENATIDDLTMKLIDASEKNDHKKMVELGTQIRALGDQDNPESIKLASTRYRQLVRAYDKLMAPGKEGPGKSDPEAMRYYTLRAQQGLLDDDDAALMEGQLSRSDMKAILRKDAANKTSSPAKREYDRLGKQLLRKVSKSDGQIFQNDEDANKYYNTAMELEKRYWAFTKDKGRPPTLEETQTIHAEILKAKKAAGETILDDQPASGPAAPTGNKGSIRERLLKKKE